jgi:AcrR family transcriptional regulator
VSTPPVSPPIWARPEPGARRSRFSRDQIAAAALVIADAEGFEAVSIRRVAAALGAGTMSLYRYISAKSDLVALMDDAIMGEALIPDGQLPAGWREALAAIARSTRAALLAHPWAVPSRPGPGGPAPAPAPGVGARAAPGPGLGPNGRRHREQSLTAVAAAPLDRAGQLDLLAIVDDYVYGHVLRAGDPAAGAGAGQLARRFERGLQALLDGAAADSARSSG